MRSPWGFFVSASVLLISTHGAAAADPPADPAAAASRIVDEIQSAASTVRHQLQAARAQRDVIKTVCLNDKLTQLDVAMRSAREQRDALLTLGARGRRGCRRPGARAARRLPRAGAAGRRRSAPVRRYARAPERRHRAHLDDVATAAGVVEYPRGDDVFAAVQPPIQVSAFK